MRTKVETDSEEAEKRVRDIRRATRRQYSAEEKMRIVVAGLRGEDSIAELCRKEGINQNLYYRWSKDFLEAGKKRLAGDTARAATSDEVKEIQAQARQLKELVAELMIENRLLKKSVLGGGESDTRGIAPPRSWRSSAWSSSRRYRCSGPWPNSASRAPPSTPGTGAIWRAAPGPWKMASRRRAASGTGFRIRSRRQWLDLPRRA